MTLFDRRDNRRHLTRVAVLSAMAFAGACANSSAGPGTEDAGSDPGPAADASTQEGSPDPDSGRPGADGSLPTDGAPPADGAAADVADAGDVGNDGPLSMPDFLVGYNEAWFGTRFGTDLTTDFDPAYVQNVLDGIRKAGGHLVRIWLFEGLQGIARAGTTPPQTQSVSPTLLANVDQVLSLARARGLWVYITALGYTKYADTQTYYTNLFNDTGGEGAAYQAIVLTPLLAVLDGHKENIFGFDLVNEIEGPINDGLWADRINGPRAFIQRTRAFVKSKSPWLRVTSTAGYGLAQYEISSGFFSGLGLDFYDLHMYSDDGTYAGATGVCDKAAADGVPIYLGEFGQMTQGNNDGMQYTATQNFLANAKSAKTSANGPCFKGAFAWRYDAAEATWAYVAADGGFRPAVSLMQAYGGP